MLVHSGWNSHWCCYLSNFCAGYLLDRAGSVLLKVNVLVEVVGFVFCSGLGSSFGFGVVECNPQFNCCLLVQQEEFPK